MDHETPQNATLSPRQEHALAALLAGQSVTGAAELAGVDRTSVHRWLREDYTFQAALSGGKRELRDVVQARLMRVGEAAAEVVTAAVEGGNVRAALAVLKGLGLLDGRPLEVGGEDPERLRAEAELSAREREEDHSWRELIAGA